VFHLDSDSYTYSAETLVGVFLAKEDAETGLLEHIAKAEVLQAKHDEFMTRIREAQRTASWITARDISGELSDWRKETFGSDYAEIPDTNIDNYSVEPVEVGAFRPL
jgi:hypothetical protein